MMLGGEMYVWMGKYHLLAADAELVVLARSISDEWKWDKGMEEMVSV